MGGRILAGDDRRSFDGLATSLGGQIGLAVSPLGRGQRVQDLGTLRTGDAWSTAKVPIAMAIVAAGGEEAHQSDLARAITASDNAAAERLWTALGGGATAAQAADAQLRDAGDEHTQIESRPLLGPAYTSFGQTEWSLRDQATFTAGLPCVGAAGDVLALMGRVVPAQRWGLGASEANAEFKGGWGPGTQPGVGGGYLDRQLGLITIAGRWLAVAIAARPADGSHQTGAAELTTIARWLVDHADVHDLPTKPEC